MAKTDMATTTRRWLIDRSDYASPIEIDTHEGAIRIRQDDDVIYVSLESYLQLSYNIRDAAKLIKLLKEQDSE